MTKPSNIPTIEKATGISWDDWLSYFDEIGAKDLSHKEIAERVHEKLVHLENGGWWSQGVTVAYEQHIGRREPGQRSDGSYETSASKTVDGTMDDVLEKWIQLTTDKPGFNGVALEKEPTWSATEKWRNWRCALVDGTRVAVSIYQKTPEKASLGLGHLKLKSNDEAETWKVYWKEFLKEL